MRAHQTAQPITELDSHLLLGPAHDTPRHRAAGTNPPHLGRSAIKHAPSSSPLAPAFSIQSLHPNRAPSPPPSNPSKREIPPTIHGAPPPPPRAAARPPRLGGGGRHRGRGAACVRALQPRHADHALLHARHAHGALLRAGRRLRRPRRRRPLPLPRRRPAAARPRPPQRLPPPRALHRLRGTAHRGRPPRRRLPRSVTPCHRPRHRPAAARRPSPQAASTRRGSSPSGDEREAVPTTPAAAWRRRRPRQGHPRQPGRLLAAGAGSRAHDAHAANLRLRRQVQLHPGHPLPPHRHHRPLLMRPRRRPGRPPTIAGA